MYLFLNIKKNSLSETQAYQKEITQLTHKVYNNNNSTHHKVVLINNQIQRYYLPNISSLQN